MKRREFMALVAGAAGWSFGVRAQQPKKVLGIVGSDKNSFIQVFLRRLRELGWIEGQNIHVESRFSPTSERMAEAAADFVRMKVDVIFAPASPQVEAAKQLTTTIPIVFAAHGDPVGIGHVASLARPGGNITGSSNLVTELSAKGLEILRETIPKTVQIGILWDPTAPAANFATIETVVGTATKVGFQVNRAPVRTADEIEGALSKMAQAGVVAFVAIASPLTFNSRSQLAELPLKYRLASVFSAKENVAAGGLMSYGPNFDDLARRGADYVDKILRGAKPADLPVEQASKYELVINLKTAKALGLTIPTTLLARADEVIE